MPGSWTATTTYATSSMSRKTAKAFTPFAGRGYISSTLLEATVPLDALGPLFACHDDPLDIDEQEILSSLGRGRMSAIPAGAIADRLAMDERKVRQVIRHLIDCHHAVIGSATDSPPGFYLVTDPGELADVVGALRHRGISILARAARISGNSIESIFHQGVLEIEAQKENTR
jgi:hypothetical protein